MIISCNKQGFTLIELSIVLVIIGLIIGGVLVGQDLIGAAGTRATLSQIEKYNTAVHTFQTKYGYLPGDIPDPYASQFGFQARGIYTGEGDGNGVIEGIYGNAANNNSGEAESAGESIAFWADMGTANFTDGGGFMGSPNTVIAADVTTTTTPNIKSYLPQAKMGSGNYIYVWATPQNCLCTSIGNNGVDYFGISAVNTIQKNGSVASTAGLTVSQAYNMDKKVDDGFPQSGRVIAFYLGGANYPAWAGNSTNNYGQPFTTATTGTSATCFDNGASAGAQQQYSMKQGNGSGPNCAISFKFQ